jgi:hypothetical protein
MWDGVVESGKCITIYYDTTLILEVHKKEYLPLAAYVVDLEGIGGLIMTICNIGVRIHFSSP